jgi:hypothetical protein
MWAEIAGFLQVCFTGACLPASLLLALALLYWLLAIVAGLDLDFLDFDFDIDGQPDLESSLSVGLVVLRFLNLGRVPLVIWGSVFAIAYWLVTLLLDRLADAPELRLERFYVLQYTVRNLVLGVLLTKVITQPLRDKFEPAEPNRAEDLIGRECRITTSQVTQTFGQAQVPTDAAPLILNVRVKQTPLAQGEPAVLVEFDPDQNVYFIEKAQAEV